MSKRSPGPWQWVVDGHKRLVSAEGREVVCGWYCGDVFRRRGEVSCNEEDGRLIAAAPAMYELLVAAAVTEKYEGGWPGCREAIRALLTSIDGTEGEP